jgi:predicted metal-dependent hydrolase
MSEIKYSVIFSRRRSMSIIISPEKGVTVRAPYRTSMNAIEKYVREKSSWIEKHTEKFSDLKRINKLYYSNGETHLLLGREITLKITESVRPFVRLYDNFLEVGINKTEDARGIKIFLERWYREKAHDVFSARLGQILNRHREYSFNPSGFSIRTLKSRWGSCNSKGRITLNTQLVKLNEPFIDYVIIHELCHLKHHNHGKEFYKLLEEIVPDYKSVRKELKKYISG